MWNIGGPIGLMFGGLIAGWVGDRIGRRRMLAFATISTAIGVAIYMVSDRPPNYNSRCAVFFVARIVQGTAVGTITTTTQVYMSEIVPQQLRGSILPFFPIFQFIGQILGAVVVQTQMKVPGRKSYLIPYATQWAFGILPFVLSLLIPESPAWLLRKGRPDAALAAHKRLQSTKSRPGAHVATFAALQSTIAHETQSRADEQASYALCFKTPHLRRTALVCLCNCLPEVIGSHLLGSANYFLQRRGIGMSPSLANILLIVGIALGLVANISSLWTLSVVGRRRLILWTLTTVAVLWGIISLVGSIVKQGPVVRW